MPPTIISVQSLVSFGHVGNTVAAFALERLGVNVCIVPTIILSSHKGHREAGGFAPTASDFSNILDGLERKGLFASADAVLSGYLGTAALGQTLMRYLNHHPNCRYILDPVMGDKGVGMFVEPALPTFFKEQASNRATIFTPNQFELETLTGQAADTLVDARTAARRLLKKPDSFCVVTSFESTELKGQIGNLLVSPTAAYLVTTPKLDGRLNGTGDLFAALLSGHYLLGATPKIALERATASIFEIASYTFEQGGGELRLVEAQKAIVEPQAYFQAHHI